MKCNQKHAVNDVMVSLFTGFRVVIKATRGSVPLRFGLLGEPSVGVISLSNRVSFGLKVLYIDHKTDCVIRTAVHHCGGMAGSPAGLRPRPNGCIMR